jgi:branched-chain amino acid transport system substrate-binding protein
MRPSNLSGACTQACRWARPARGLASYIGVAAFLITLAFRPGPAFAQFSDGVVRIGVLTDLSGQYADASGQGSVIAARLAAEDHHGRIGSIPIEIVSADHQNKPDIGATIVRRWFDQDGVDAITDIPVSSIALAAQEIGREKHRTLLIAGAATSDLTGRACSPFSTHWADDTYALANGTARAITEAGGTSWYFLTVDYAFGYAMERDASQAVTAAGGRVLGSIRHPLGASDFSSFVVEAMNSHAKVIGLANVGSDTSNAIRAAGEFGLGQDQKLAGFLIFLTDVHGLGLEKAKGLLISDGFYWDQNEAARAFAGRFFDRVGRMPTKEQAAVYASVSHYLKAAAAAGTDDAARVNETMRAMPVDYLGREGSIRADGRVLYDLTLYAVKSPAESANAWDAYKPVRTIDKASAFRPVANGGCPLVPH